MSSVKRNRYESVPNLRSFVAPETAVAVADPEPPPEIDANPTLSDVPPRPSRYLVRLQAQTPLAHAELEVEADSPSQAWERFCQRNGISGSDCPKEIIAV